MNDSLHLWSGLYATNSLDDIELADFEHHLAHCPDCEAEVSGFSATLTELAVAVAQPVPDGLRQSVLAEVLVTRQASPVVSEMADHRAPTGRPPAHRRRLASHLAAAAMVVLVTGAAAVAIQGLDRRADRAEQIAALVSRSDARTIDLQADGRSGAKVVWSPEVEQAVVLADNMPPVESGKAYELWVIRDGTPHPGTLFRPDDRGTLRHTFDARMTDSDVVGVTIEPAAGSSQPTGRIVMSSSS